MEGSVGAAGTVPISPDEGLLGAVREAPSRRFMAAWLGWRGSGRLVPPRSAMELVDIRDLLGSVALFEISGPDDIRFKMAGARLREYANFEASGKNFAELTPPAVWPIRRYRMMRMACWPCAGISTKHDVRRLGEGSNFEIVTLPIGADAPGGMPLLISCVTPIGDTPAPPAPDREPVMLLADGFRFVDIGAGTPARTQP
jgi:hypothetical protein